MIRGFVNAHLEAILRLTVRGPNGQIRRVTAIVDMGFDGWLSLPSSLIATSGAFLEPTRLRHPGRRQRKRVRHL